MLVFGAIMPHSPLLIPGVGKDNLKKLKKTERALKILATDLAQTRPELIIIISPHGDLYPDAFTINTMTKYLANFETFGDFETRAEYRSDIPFINRFKERVESRWPLMLKSNEVLDHGVSVPLHFLSGEKMDFAIVPVNYCFLSYQKHYDFGVELKEAIFNSDKRIAVIASGDLSHRLSLGAPAGFSARAKDFDKKLVQLLKQRKAEGVLNIDRELIEEAGECGLRSILVLLGVFEDLNYSFQVLSYEAPFGVGYLVGECQLP